MTRTKLTHTEYIAKAIATHGDRYDYSETKYINTNVKIRVRCIEHDEWFEQHPQPHLRFNGCASCKFRLARAINLGTTEEFISKARAVHGSRYDYSEVVYKSFWEKVAIKCNDHGVFWQGAGFHTSFGNGCPSCARGGYNPSKIGTLYVLSSGDVTKVGITNLTAQSRVAYIKYTSPYEFSIYKEYSGLDGHLCEQIESEILTFLRSKYQNPTEKFHGHTECFINVDRDELLYLLDNKLNKI